MLVAALVLFLADVVVILLLVSLAQEMGKECTTQASAAYNAATDQKTAILPSSNPSSSSSSGLAVARSRRKVEIAISSSLVR